jgi:predicted transposase/invertase (TIGR01784 family)
MEQGREEGREEGMREAKLEIAKQLLDVLDEATISQKTGLSLEEVQKLKEGGE